MSDWIDVTRVLVDGMSGWPGDPPFRLSRVADLDRDGVMVTEIHTSAHIGTHVDAPLHCVAGSGDVASLNLRQLCGPAVVIDLAGRAEVTVADLRGGCVRPGDRVLIRSGDAVAPSVVVAIEAARWLVEQEVPLLGIEGPSPERADTHELPVHRTLLGAGLVILENLDLTHVSPGRYEMVALPLPIRGCEASPARVILRPAGK